MTRGLSFSAAKQISTEEMLVISEHLDAGSGPPKDQRTKTDGMALLLIPEGGLHSSIDSLVTTLYLLSRYSAFLKSSFTQMVHWHHKRFITPNSQTHLHNCIQCNTRPSSDTKMNEQNVLYTRVLQKY